MVQLRLTHEDERQIRFASSPWSAVLMAVAGLGVLGLATILEGAARWACAFMGLFGFVGGVYGALGRCDTVFDFAARTYSITQGFWPRLRTSQGPFSDIEYVALSCERRQRTSQNTSSYMVWTVGLKLWHDAERIDLLEELREQQAQEMLESLATRLGAQAVEPHRLDPLPLKRMPGRPAMGLPVTRETQ